MTRKRLGELLVEEGLIDGFQLRSALAEQRKFGRPLGRVVVEMGMFTEASLVDVLSRQLRIPSVKLAEMAVDPAAARQVDIDFCQQLACLPFRYDKRGRFLDVAMADPTNQEAFDELRVRTRCNIRPFLAGPIAIDHATRRAFGAAQPRSWETAQWPAPDGERVIDLEAPAPGQPKPSRGPPEPAPQAATQSPGSSPPRPLSTGPQPRQPPAEGEPSPATGRKRRTIEELALAAAPTAGGSEIDDLRAEVGELRAMIERDEQVLRRLMVLIVDKGLCTREELLARIKGNRQQ
jgi:type IV pilus assembly protein PilB